jgi:hypothetical protein
MTTTTKTKEKPILFSTPLVQAILEGRKSQTRRVMKPQPKKNDNGFWEYAGAGWSLDSHVPVVPGHSLAASCPYGKPGDELWVRETFAFESKFDDWKPSICRPSMQVHYFADGYTTGEGNVSNNIGRKRPSIHMPRWASRIQLTVTDIRVERVQEITESDARAEGCCTGWEDYPKTNRELFAELWDSINAARGYSWESNPWVWVVEFEIKDIKGA